jgi:AbrB family looped-hinge helix DNA binding protein
MPIVTVKNKYQVVIPAKVRRQIGIEVGDLLEAKVERGKVTFIPKSAVDREIAEGLEDMKNGRTYGPFATAEEMIGSLHAIVKKRKGKDSRRK